MAKSKSMTSIVVALSVLLVLSLTATIALAYFSASRTATTTITFDAGIVLEVSGIKAIGESTDYVWMTDKTAEDPTNSKVSAGSSVINLSEIGIRVTGADAYVAVKPTINVTPSGKPVVTPDMATNWTQVGTSGWYVYKYNNVSNAAVKMTVTESASFVPAVQSEAIGSVGNINDYAGATYECEVNVWASDTLEGLEELIQQDINGNSTVGA